MNGYSPPWRDPARPARERVADLLARMTLEEKAAQTYSVWLSGEPGARGGGEVAPYQHEMVPEDLEWGEVAATGLGHLTRPFGTAPVEPAEGAGALARTQRELMAGGRFGIPAIAHEECLAGLKAWKATIFPVPLAWGAAFDPALVRAMARRIGGTLRSLGVHQGLAPVLDVSRDPRWGRTEETIGEDPYLVGTVGTAYAAGLEEAGIIATLKHFAGYSASRAARNLAPVAAGPREVADVLLPPFEMAVRESGARSVMSAYTDTDGVPAHADPALLTGVLRQQWGFTGTVVSDYFGVSFLQTLHGVAAGPADAAALALAAGVDVELPAVRCYGRPLLDAVRDGSVAGELVERAARRVLLQKCELGLLDPGFSPEPPAVRDGAALELDPPDGRELAGRLAEESVVLLANDGALPLSPGARIAVTGPLADDPDGLLGCYSFPRHVGADHPGLPEGVDLPTVLDALRKEVPRAELLTARGADVDGDDRGGILQAVAAARQADVCVAVLGDRAGLFGRGTSGEGCDREDLNLPGVQGELLDALLAAGTPVVLVLLTGRPYALGAYADRAAAVVQAFFPGEEGGRAVAGVLSGRVNPSGRLPVSVPRGAGGQPATYLAAPLAQRTESSSVDPTPLHPFGHGLSYTSFDWTPRTEGPLQCATDAAVTAAVAVRNTGDRAGTEVVQLYLHDPLARVALPAARLIGYARVGLQPGETREVSFAVHAEMAAYTGPDGLRIVEPGRLELRFAASSAEVLHTVPVTLTGPQRAVGHERTLTTKATVR